MTLVDLLKIINSAGLVGLLSLVLISGAKGWWVFGWIYREKCESEEEWKRQALRGASNAEKATSLAEAIARAIEDQQAAAVEGDSE